MDAEDSNEDDLKIEDVLERVGDVHDCPHCGEVFSSLFEVEGHISINHGKFFNFSHPILILCNDKKCQMFVEMLINW